MTFTKKDNEEFLLKTLLIFCLDIRAGRLKMKELQKIIKFFDTLRTRSK